jgi:hypothetical protein
MLTNSADAGQTRVIHAQRDNSRDSMASNLKPDTRNLKTKTVSSMERS